MACNVTRGFAKFLRSRVMADSIDKLPGAL